VPLVVSSKPAKARYTSALELLKQRLRRFLRRDLTAREEHLLELTEPILKNETEKGKEKPAA